MDYPSSEASIIRFDDKEAAKAELVWVQSRGANARCGRSSDAKQKDGASHGER